MQTYMVKAGDTLYGISNQYGVSVTELAELNNIKGFNLQIGQKLVIPDKTGNNPNNLFMYTVKKGDSLYKIAQKYNTTVQAIKDLNYLKSDNLSIGQIIRIPEMYTPEDEMIMPSYKNYIVKKGDSLYSVSKNNNISIDILKKDNGLTSNTLMVGQILKIRLPSQSQIEVLECFGEDYIPPDSDSYITYTVKKGDSLYSIARAYNTSVSSILNLNNLPNANLSIGQQLKVPSLNSNSITYTVKKGDNLYDIAKKYNTTVNNIKKKNNLNSNLLSVGQILLI